MPNILVIDDDDIMLKAIKNILNKDGFNVVTATDGKEAFELLDHTVYDIVITDLMLPHANGLEVVGRLRHNEMSRNVGIIVVSSVGNEETITEAFRLGADDYLKKPIMAGELLMRIRKLIANKNSKTQFVTKKK
jgi:DNA-binding response OmpR family regulator